VLKSWPSRATTEHRVDPAPGRIFLPMMTFA
jgi:hypothetical protein